MKLFWTRSNLPLSRLLCWGLREPCSHFAVGFACSSDGSVGTVFMSDFLGSHIAYFGTFKKSHVIVHEVDIPLSLGHEDAVYNSVVQRFDGRPYDYDYFMEMVGQVALNRVFGVPLPKYIKAPNPHADLCFEVFSHLPQSILPPSSLAKNAFVTPERLYRSLNLDGLAATCPEQPQPPGATPQ